MLKLRSFSRSVREHRTSTVDHCTSLVVPVCLADEVVVAFVVVLCRKKFYQLLNFLHLEKRRKIIVQRIGLVLRNSSVKSHHQSIIPGGLLFEVDSFDSSFSGSTTSVPTCDGALSPTTER